MLRAWIIALSATLALSARAATFDGSFAGSTVVQIVQATSASTVTATGSSTPRTLADRASDVVNVRDFGAKCDGTTDDTAAVLAALTAAAVKGGTIFTPAGVCKIAGQITIPNSGGGDPTQKPVRLVGIGAHFTGDMVAPPAPAALGGSVWDLTYNGTTVGGKLLTVGNGTLEISGMTFTDSSGGSLPFLYTTATTLLVHHSSFFGSKQGTACNQDAIVLGGTTTTAGTGNVNDAFRGYGTVIADNYFDYIRRAVYARVYADGVVVRGNTVWRNSGSNLPGGAAIEFDGTGGYATGNVIVENLIEQDGYPYGLKFSGGANYNYVAGNTLWDPTSTNSAAMYFSSIACNNVVLFGFAQGYNATVEDHCTSAPNTIIGGLGGNLSLGQFSVDAAPLKLYAPDGATHVYMAFYPQASRSTRGAYIGFGAEGATDLTVQSDTGAVLVNAKSGSSVTFNRPTVVARNYNMTPGASGTLTTDANLSEHYLYNLTGAGPYTMAISGGFDGQRLSIHVRNTSGGAVTINAGSGTKLAGGAWPTPATGTGRIVQFINYGGAWYETYRSAADVPN